MCDTLKVDDHTRFVTVLTGYAESDYSSDAVQYGKTFGVYQQNPTYWPSATLGTLAQCEAFIADFQANTARHNGDPVRDAWVTQRWELPGANWPDVGPLFESEKARVHSESWNYAHRVPLITQIINERRLP